MIRKHCSFFFFINGSENIVHYHSLFVKTRRINNDTYFLKKKKKNDTYTHDRTFLLKSYIYH